MSEIYFEYQIRKTGGSLTIALAPELVKAMELKEGHKLRAYLVAGEIILRRAP